MTRLSSLIVGLVFLTGCSPTSVEYRNSGSPPLGFELRRSNSESTEGWKSIVFSPVGASAPETLYVSPNTEISNADLKSTSVKKETTGTWTIVLTLNETAKPRFADLSTKLSAETEKKERIAVMVDGKTLVAPYITAPMTDGVISITGPFTEEEAHYIAKSIVGA